MAKRVQPQTDPGTSDYNYGYDPTRSSGGARRVQNTGGFGPDANAIRDQGQTSFQKMYQRIREADEKQRDEEPATMEANVFDKMAADLYDIGEGVTPGFIRDMQQSDNLAEKAAGVVLGAPFGTLGAIPQGLAQGYEFAFGRGVTRDDQDSDTVEVLDANERAASGVNALINVGGAAMGGSGRMLKGGYRAARTILGDAAEQGTKNAVRNAAGAVSKGWKEIGKDIVGDMAEEAGEEFVQSLADDARYGTADESSFSRAVESAAWGALGGAAMSGMGHGLNRLASFAGEKRGIGDAGPDSDDPSIGRSDVRDNDAYNLQYGDQGEKRYMTAAAQEAYTRRVEGRATDWPGSRSATLMQANDKSQGVNEAKIGTDAVRSIWLANNDDRSAKVIEDAFGMTHDEARSLFSAPDWSQQLRARYDAIRANGDNVTMYWARNPATKGRQPIKSDITELFDGDGVMLHPLVMPLVGADVDGDKMFVTLSDEATENAQYATSLLVDPETGDHTIGSDDWLRTGIGSRVSKETLARIISDTLKSETRTYRNRSGVDVTVDALSAVSNSLKGTGRSIESMAEDMSRNLADGDYGSVIDAIGADAQAVGFDRDRIIQDVIRNLATSDESSMVASIDAIISNAPDFAASESAPAAGIPGSGSTPRNYSYSQMLVDWNQLVFAEADTKGNPPFRQYGEMGYRGKSVPSYLTPKNLDALHQRIVDLTNENFNSNDKLQNFLVACLKETNRGSNVENSIETKLTSYIRSRVLNNTGLRTHRIGGVDDLKTVMREFVEARNQASKWAHDAKSALTNRGWRVDMDTPLMKEAAYSDDVLNDTKMMSEFVRIFGDMDPDSVFDTTAFPARFDGMSIREIVRDINGNRYSSGTELMASGRDISAIFDAMSRAMDSNKVAVSNLIFDQVGTITDRLAIISKRAQDGIVSENDLAEASFLLNAINEIVGGSESLEIGMYDPATFLRSRWGREIASGDPKRAMRAVVSMSLTGQFRPVLRLFNEAADQFEKNYAAHRANEMARNSKLHEAIVAQLIKNDGESDFLRYLTDLDVTWEQMQADFRKTFDTDGDRDNLLLMALTDKTSEFDLTDINARRRRAITSYNSGVKVSYDNAQADVDAVRMLYQNGAVTDQILCNAIEDAVNECYIDMDNAALAMMIIDADNFGNQSLEKATLELAPQLFSQGIEILANGGMSSEVDHAVNESIMRMPISQFTGNRRLVLGVLSGRIDKIQVYDNNDPSCPDTIVSRDSMFSEYVSGWVDGSVPTAHDWLTLLQAQPQLASMIAPHEVQQRSVEGSPNTSSAISETLASYVKNYAKQYTTTGPDIERAAWIANTKRKIRNRIRRIPGLSSVVSLMIPDLDVRINDPRALQDACDRYMDAIVDAAYDRVMTRETGDAIERVRNEEEIDLIDTMMSDLTSCIKNAQILSMSLDINQQVRNELESHSRVFMADTMYRMMADRIVREVSDNKASVIGDTVGTIDTDSFTDFNERITEDVKNELDAFMHQALASYKIVFEFTDRNIFDAAFNPNSDVVESVNSTIDSIIDLTADQKAAIKDRLGSLSDIILGYVSDIELDDVVTDADINPALSDRSPDQMKADLKAKARRIWSKSQTKYRDSIDDQIDEVIDGNVENLAVARRNLKRVLDSEYLGNYLREMSFSTGAKVNQNAIGLLVDCKDIFREIEREARAAVGNDGTTDITRHGDPRKFPTIHILNPRVQAIVTKLNSTDVPAGMVSTETGLNGSQYRTNAAYGVLPRNRVCSSAPRRMTVAQIIEAATNDPDSFDLSKLHYAKQRTYDPNWTYSPDGRGDMWTLDNFTPEMIQGIMSGDHDPNQVWFVFVPEDCDDGLCVAHQVTPIGTDTKGYLSIPNIINRITQYAQEAMNLKRKKRPASLSFLGHEVYDKIADDSAVRIASDASGAIDDATVNSLYNMFAKSRKSVEDHLTKWFSTDDMSSLGYGRDQARQLSMVMAQGLRVTFNGAGGPVVKMVPKRDFMVVGPDGRPDIEASRATFADYVSRLRESTGDQTLMPSMAQQQLMTIEELSTRGMWNVINNYSDGMSNKRISELCLEGMTNLDAVNPGTLTMRNVFSRMSPVGMAYDNIIQSSVTPSTASALLDAMYGANQHSLRSSISMKGLAGISNQADLRAIADFNNRWRDEGTSRFNAYRDSKIYYAFGARDFHSNYSKSNYPLLSDLYDEAVTQFNNIPENSYYPDGMAMTFDLSGVQQAIQWSRTHRLPFCIPEQIYRAGGIADAMPTDYYPYQKTIVRNGQPIQLVVFDPIMFEDLGNLYASNADSKFKPEIKDVMAVMQSTPGMSMADAGSFINMDTAGYITIEHNTLESDTVDHYLASGVSGVTRMASIDDVRDVAQKIADGDLRDINLRYLSDIENLSNEEIRIELDRFAQWVLSAKEPKSVRTTARAGEIVTFMVTKSGRTGRDVFTPIALSRSGAQDEYRNIEVVKNGGTIAIGYDSATDFADNLHGDGEPRLYCHKIAVNGVAFKSMGTPIDPGTFRRVSGSEMPMVAATIGGDRTPIDIIIDSGAVSGRIEGKDQSILLSNLWYYSHGKCAINPFIKTNEDGSISFSDDLVKIIGSDRDRYSQKRMVDLLSGSGDIQMAREVANGNMILSTDDDVRKMIKNIFKRSLDHDIYPMSLISSAQLSEDLVNQLYPIIDEDTGQLIAPKVTLKNGLVRRAPSVDYQMVLGYLGFEDTLTFFNWMDPRLCPDPRQDSYLDDGSTVFDLNGNTYVYVGNDPATGQKIASRQMIFWGPVHALGKGSQIGTPSTSAKRGAQMRASQAYDNGMSKSDGDFFVQWFSELINRPDIMDTMRDHNDLFPKDRVIAEDIGYTEDPDYLNRIMTARFTSRSQELHWEKVRSAGEIYRKPLPFQDVDGTVIDNPSRLLGDRDVAASVAKLNKALRGDGHGRFRPLTIDEVLALYVNSSGQTRTDKSPSKYPSLKQLSAFIDEMAENIEKSGIPVTARRTSTDDKSRYSIALLPQEFARELFDSSPVLRSKNSNSFNEFSRRMHDEQAVCIDMINAIKDKAKRNELYRLCDWLSLNWGEDPDTSHIYGNMFLSDMVESNDIILKACGDYMFSPRQVQWFRDNAKIQAEKIAKIAKNNDMRVRTAMADPNARNGEVVRYDYRNYEGAERFLRNAAELSRFMSMINPAISIANILDRAVHQGTTNALMAWSMNHGIGPYKSSFVPNQDIVRVGADSDEASKVFDMIRYASYDGDEARVLASIHSMDDVNSYLSSRKDALSNQRLAFIPRKAVEWVFEKSGGGNVMAKYQRRNWFNQFARIISSDAFNQGLNGEPNPLLQPTSEGGLTLLEEQWIHNPDQLLVSVFRNADNPYHSAAVRALQFSRAGEATQSNILSAMYSSLAKRYPAVEFFTTTCVSRFFLYSTNMTGRILNLVAPISAVNYMLNDVATRIDKNNRFNFGDLQMYTSFKEALLVDVTHMAPAVVSLILASITGLFTPPDDEDKRGNYDEWLIGGQRIGEDWMLKDILGLSGPLACFFSGMFAGEVRFDLLWNGFLDCCYNNPIIRAGSVINIFADPESSFSTDFEEDAARYEDAPGGTPDLLDWLGGRAFSGALSWGSQFVTPSIARELVNSIELQPYERAYRYVIATDERGEQVIDPDTGRPQYQETSYLDAQIRRVTRTNPVLGLAMDLLKGTWITGNTGYLAWEQPRTVYYDDAQLESMRIFSVNDENGEPLPADQQQEKIYMVLSQLMSYDDMEELAATGFYLDYDTKMAVGDTIHDIIQTMRDDYSEMNAAGYFDYYYGGLDYDTGRARAETLKSQYYDELNFWQDLYYNKLWSEPMKRPLQMYNRYNTTYAQDANGEWYATGIYNSLNPLYHNAPGSLHDAGGTAGYGHDWRTVSAVTGEPMDQRALIPVEAGYLDTPDLDSLGDDSNGGYSKSFPGWSYANSIDGDGYDYGDGGGWGWRNYGGGGYSRRRSGGGGGGYSPNIYSRLPNVYPSGARTMYAERIYGPNYDYLRPNFETKGSREAYKRSDI